MKTQFKIFLFLHYLDDKLKYGEFVLGGFNPMGGFILGDYVVGDLVLDSSIICLLLFCRLRCYILELFVFAVPNFHRSCFCFSPAICFFFYFCRLRVSVLRVDERSFFFVS